MRRSTSGGGEHDELRAFLVQLGLESHLAALVREDVVDLAGLRLLTDADMRGMGLTKGARVKVAHSLGSHMAGPQQVPSGSRSAGRSPAQQRPARISRQNSSRSSAAAQPARDDGEGRRTDDGSSRGGGGTARGTAPGPGASLPAAEAEAQVQAQHQALEVAQREMESLRETLRLQDQQVKSTMQQVTDGALRAEGHKSEIVRVSQRHSESERRMQDVHEREVESLRRELARLESDLDAQAATAKEDAARHAVEMAERLRQQGALQQRENELLRAQLAREADLSKAEGRWAAKLEQQERRHKKEIAEHARQRELREQERERERQAARDEIAAAKELKNERQARIEQQAAELNGLREKLTGRQQECAAIQAELQVANAERDRLRSEHKRELATQNAQIDELAAKAEAEAAEAERDRARAHEVEETLQGKINELVAMLAELTVLHENLVPAEPAEADASEQKRE